MSVLVLVVDDEPDVEALFRQQFRRDLRAQRFVMDFAISASDALARISSTIEVATEPGQFTEFTVVLPRTSNLSSKT